MCPLLRSYRAETAMGIPDCSSLPRRFADSKLSRDAMNFLPRSAKRPEVLAQHSANVREIAPGKSVIFPKIHRSVGTVQIEYRFAAAPDHMDVSGPMVVRA